MYHAIIINKQFIDESYPLSKKVFAKKIDGSWEIYGVEVLDEEIDNFIEEVQQNMRSEGTWYAHAYNDTELIVIFKNKVMKVTPHQSSWTEIIEYGRTLGIQESQLDFWPNRFQDERHYFL